jgi:hypothetical protein
LEAEGLLERGAEHIPWVARGHRRRRSAL